MGLDNGIRVKGLNRNSFIGKLFQYPFRNDYGDDAEICYWRKCWNIRRAILGTFPYNGTLDAYRYAISRETVKDIRAEIQYFLDHPDEWDDSIWEFSEMKGALERDLRNLRILYLLMGVNKKLIPYFYDSY